MSEIVTISSDAIVRQLKLSCQIPSVTNAIATSQIIARKAEACGIEVEPNELQQAADKFRQENHLLSSDATWSWLQKYGLSLDDFEELIYDTVLSSKLARHLFANKVEPFFVERQLDYSQVVMYEIVLRDRDLAMELFYALQENEISFWEVARQYIQEPELRRSLGYRGILSRAELKPEISAAVFASHPPQILKPIIISKNAHLIFVEELLQRQLDEELRAQILSDLFSDWLTQQIEQAELVTSLK
ncbi:MAG: peptidylprolyl isomerase [Hydrococcus sp. Prado102]|jgi:parvulin-like peptidyl-prolyl isomerase|nr:peptidylprolyl isomerase [Hydrococcus sp. Prado102]